MVVLTTESPLQWPEGIARTERFARQFRPSFQADLSEADALLYIRDELDQLGEVNGAILFSDYVNIGTPMQANKLSMDTGVCLRFHYQKLRYQLCCDRWASVAHNIYALHLGLRYFRQMESWGVGSLHRLMVGFSDRVSFVNEPAEIDAVDTQHNWRYELGLGPNATLDDANAVYRARAKKIGESDPAALSTLNEAIQKARQHLS
jgi:hypothetical protein